MASAKTPDGKRRQVKAEGKRQEANGKNWKARSYKLMSFTFAFCLLPF
jgi:hypothetical protein